MENFKEITKPFQRLAKLYIESGRLSLTEALTRILAAALITFVCLLLVIIALSFVSYGVIVTLSDSLSSTWAYVIVGGFYLLIIALLVIFKRTLVINPIARFLSKVLLDAPENLKNTHCHEQK